MKQFLVLLFFFVPFVLSRSTNDLETVKCVTDYLKSVDVIPSDSRVQPDTLCFDLITVTKANMIDRFRLEIMAEQELRAETDCILKGLTKSDLGNKLLLLFVSERSEEGVESEKEGTVKRIEDEMARDTFNQLLKCRDNSLHNEIFDDIFKNETEEIDPQEDYCVRKRIIDNNLLSIDNAKLQLNPQNIDTSNIDCDEIYKNALKTAEDELAEGLLKGTQGEGDYKFEQSTVTCVLGVIREGNFINSVLQFDYMKELNLNDAQKDQARELVGTFMVRLSQGASKCFRN